MALITFASMLVIASVASAGPIYSVPVTYVALPSIPENVYNQVRDTRTGEYAFGYVGGPVAREEARTADGVIRGAYSYVDAHGIVQHYRYIADDTGFRVAGTNIPTDAAATGPVPLEPQLAVPYTEAIVSEAVAVPKKSEEPRSRKKRSAIYSEVPILVETIPAQLVIASAPTATSNQSRMQIHKSLKAEVPVETVAAIFADPAAVPAIPVAAKATDILPEAAHVATAALEPVATSSQSHFQIRKSLKAEIPVEPVSAISLAPVAAKNIEVVPKTAPVAVAASEPVAVSNQSHFQISESSKIETTASLAVETVAALPIAPAVAAVPLAPKTIAAIPAAVPIAVAGFLPTATSSQSRFQIHDSLKTEIQEPTGTTVETVRTAAPLVAAISDTSETIKAIPNAAPIVIATAPLPAIATTNQRRFQVYKNSKLDLNTLPQPLNYGVLDIQPAIALQPVNPASLPPISRSPIGVGLGILPSPVAAYYGHAYFARA